jgi:NAD(P)-dependent dehydrogenase (short-subunit alcohol dehydrogenase family)
MKKVIIWGSEGGIGQAIVQKFSDEGWQVAALAREFSSFSQGVAGSFSADFSKTEDMDRAGLWLRENLGEAEVLIYAAGDIASQKIAEGDPQRWQQILENNLIGLYQSVRVSLPLLTETSHIFFLGAVSERLQLPGLSAYAAAKAGVEALAVSLSKEERKKKVTVVRPGAVDTALWDKVPFKKPAHTYSPEQVAERIWEAYLEGHKGQLDLM